MYGLITNLDVMNDKGIDYYQYNVGSHFLSAIVNGDYSGLEDVEIKQLENFLEHNNLDESKGIISTEYYYHDGDTIDCTNFDKCEISGLGSEVVTLVYIPLY